MHKYLVYKHMADRIEKGWIRGELRSNDRYCLMGALREEHLNGSEQYDIIKELDMTMLPHVKFISGLAGQPKVVDYPIFADDATYERIVAIEWWNDVPWRQKNTVVRKLRRLQYKYADSYIRHMEREIVRLEKEIAKKNEELHFWQKWFGTADGNLEAELTRLVQELGEVKGGNEEG